uniref:Uncharacterized protein n=1 Tax=Anguilla anguilla TaxID=7936 RepID=A0A0E9W1G4_ANGAN
MVFIEQYCPTFTKLKPPGLYSRVFKHVTIVNILISFRT